MSNVVNRLEAKGRGRSARLIRERERERVQRNEGKAVDSSGETLSEKLLGHARGNG